MQVFLFRTFPPELNHGSNL